MKWNQVVWVVGIAGGLLLVGACSDDEPDSPGGASGNGGSAGKGGNGGSAGKGGKAGGGDSGSGGDGGIGGAAPECPAELATAPGKACRVEGQRCLDVREPCEGNLSVECAAGKWEALTGLAAPCGGAGGGGGEAGGGGAGGGEGGTGGGP